MNLRRLVNSKLLASLLVFSLVNMSVPYGAFASGHAQPQGNRRSESFIPPFMDAEIQQADLMSFAAGLSFHSVPLPVNWGKAEESESVIGGLFEENRLQAIAEAKAKHAELSSPSEPTAKQADESRPKSIASRPLSAKEMRTMRGSTGQNPYIAGSQKWAPNVNGVDMFTGNFSTSATDLSFEGGYGIPVNVTRSYSTNNPDEGPLGIGWTLSVDIRSTAGGLLKSSGAPIRSVPTSFKERHTDETDPHIPDANEPVEAVIATDASGYEQTIQKDVDGILTTPPWDKNVMTPVYEWREGTQILVQQQTATPEGTIYTYEKKGEYTNGAYPYNGSTQNTTPSNVLKITSAVDRYGNATNYTYSSSTATFAKYNGEVTENKLSSISMPNGHQITFTWGTGNDINRIVSCSDGTRTVEYEYTSGMLTSVTSPGLKETTYTYQAPGVPQGYTHPTAGPVLKTITDPRGLVTTIESVMGQSHVLPVSVFLPGVITKSVTLPNGTKFQYTLDLSAYPDFSTYFEVLYGGATEPEPMDRSSFVVHPGTYSSYLDVYEVNHVGPYGMDQQVPQYPCVTSQKSYNLLSQDLVHEITYHKSPYINFYGLNDTRELTTDLVWQAVETQTEYNFMGNPLEKTVTEKTWTSVPPTQNPTTNRTTTVEYAYHGANRYWQQKAVRSQIGSSSYRFSYTDYFDNQATTGKKGQVYRVYDEKNADFVEDTNIPVPTGTPTGDYWKYRLVPQDASKFSAEFDYDSKGRPIDVLKLQKIVSGNYDRVQTHTVYGSDGSPTWGAPTSVTEDYGSGKINRITRTLTYDSAGRAIEVEDAAGKIFTTDYNDDGQVESVTRTDTNPATPIVTYTYGTSGIQNGMVTQVVDEISDVTQDFTYSSTAGGSLGQVLQVDESRTGTSYSVHYTYNTAGDREAARYVTPYTEIRWKYSDYVRVGNSSGMGRVFQTLTRQNGSGSNWTDTEEEFHYNYDFSGRLLVAGFAQSYRSGQSSYTNHSPERRAVAEYIYEPAGRIRELNHWWHNWNGSGYTETAILGVDYTYDYYKGLRTSAHFKDKDPNNPTQFRWDPYWSAAEAYAYDADLDYLTAADYNDGVANEYQTWTYDAAGNRASDYTGTGWTYDNLNRMTASPGSISYGNDILGNRTSKTGGISYAWDEVNRMASYTGSSVTWSYKYRADGMRVNKNPSSSQFAGTDYFYDGQMPMEEYNYDNPTRDYIKVIRYGLGARGIDFIERTRYDNVTTKGYPVYDGHGNMVATLAKNGTGFAVNDRRAYDAWGKIRQGNTSGEPRGTYCANLGHVQDDESGLQYMRARYYEPWTGRFVSEDPAMAGGNWYKYAGNDPINYSDATGRDMTAMFGAFLSGIVAVLVRWAASGGKASGLQLLNAFLGGVAGYALAKMSGRITEAMEVGGAATIGGYLTGMSAAGFSNAVACLLVNLITGEDTDLGDLALAILCGAIGGGAGSALEDAGAQSGAQDMALGLFTGAMSELFGQTIH